MADKNSTFVNNSAPDVDDSWLNMTQDERNNLITSSDQAIATGTLNQCAKGVSNYSHWGNFYTDGGAANAYVLSVQSPTLAPTKLKTGMEIRFRPANSNTGASTLNLTGFGAKNIYLKDGTTALSGGELVDTDDITLRYDASLDTGNGGWIIPSNTLYTATETTPGVVELVTLAEVQGDTGGDRVVTSDVLIDAMASSQAENGYQYLPSGLIEQWGRDSTFRNSPATQAITFPITFPNAVFALVASLENDVVGYQSAVAQYSGITTSGFTAIYSEWSAVAQAQKLHYIVKGN